MDGMGVDWINRKLMDDYGRDVYGHSNYRVVYSDTQYEMRYGTFRVETEAGIYLRTETCWQKKRKYPVYSDLWVFEKVQENYGQNPEIEKGMTYEPLWVFRDKHGNKLQPEWWACQAIVQADRAIKKIMLSPSDLEAQEELRMAREKMHFKTVIQNESPYIAGAIKAGEAIVVPRNYEKSTE